jgi:hypothetical protein
MENKWIGEGYYNNVTGIKIDETTTPLVGWEKSRVYVHSQEHYTDLFTHSKILDSIIGKPYLLEIDISSWQGHLGNSYQIEVAEFNLKGNDYYLSLEGKINFLNYVQYQRIRDIYNFEYSHSEWRFPTKIEMEAIYKNKDEIIGRIDSEQSNRYWIKKNTLNDGYTSVFDMEGGSVSEQSMKTSYFKLRLVRDFDTHTQSLYTPTKIIKSNILKEGGSIKSNGTFKPLGSAKELGITPKIAGHDMIAKCDCGEKFSYQNSKKDILWQCPECNGMKRISDNIMANGGSVLEKNGFNEYPRTSPQEWENVEWSFNGHSTSFKGKMYFQKGTGFMFIEKENGELYKPKSSNKLFWRKISA